MEAVVAQWLARFPVGLVVIGSIDPGSEVNLAQIWLLENVLGFKAAGVMSTTSLPMSL